VLKPIKPKYVTYLAEASFPALPFRPINGTAMNFEIIPCWFFIHCRLASANG